MIHPKQDEIRRLIENWQAWTGDAKGAVYSVSPIAWTEMAYAKLEANRSRVNVIKPIGAEAQLTGEALATIALREAKALKARYLSSLTAKLIAKDIMRCSERHYFLLLALAHSAFWEAYLNRKDRAAATIEQIRQVTESARP